jgi:histidinol-phosphate aminotransferase
MQQKGDLLAFATPNAPTGIIESKDKLIQLISNFSNAVLCDEAYIDFAPKNSSLIPEIKNFKNLFISRTFSKSYSLAGLRVGYIISNEENIAELLKIKDSYNLGMLEQKIALEAFKDQKYLSKTVSKITNSRKKLTGKLSKKGFQVLESNTNFLFAKPPSPYKADELFEYLKSKKIFIRYFKDTLTKDYIRISIGLEKENKKLLKEIFAFCKL